MSRQATAPGIRVEELTSLPSVKSKVQASRWCTENIMPITVNAIERATVSGELASFMIGGARWYSTRDLYNWIMGRRECAQDSVVSA